MRDVQSDPWFGFLVELAGQMAVRLVLVLTLTAELAAAALVAWSTLRPERRLWPPPDLHGRPWQGRIMSCLFVVSGAGAIALGVLDWQGWGVSPAIRWGVGLPLWLSGNGLAAWAQRSLGVEATWGGEGGLADRGPYRWSRNPQYLGFVVGLLGWGLMVASAYTLIAALVGSITLFMAPFAEEPWLRERYGSDYEAYMRRVPRFVPRLC